MTSDAQTWKLNWPQVSEPYASVDFEDRNHAGAKDWFCNNITHANPVRNKHYRMICRRCSEPGYVVCRWAGCEEILKREDVVVHIYDKHILAAGCVCLWTNSNNERCLKTDVTLGNFESHVASHLDVPTLFCLHPKCPQRFFLRPQDHRDHIHTSTRNQTNTMDIAAEHNARTSYPRPRKTSSAPRKVKNALKRPKDPTAVANTLRDELIHRGVVIPEPAYFENELPNDLRGDVFMGHHSDIMALELSEQFNLLAQATANTTTTVLHRGGGDDDDDDDEDEDEFVLSDETLVSLYQVALYYSLRKQAAK